MGTKAIEQLSFEEAMAELDVIVKSLEGGSSTLDKSITDYERGIALKTHCEKKLKDAQMRIEKIIVQSDGQITTSPFETGQ